ncbi:MAG: hypothetical protein HOV78_28930 [Hamadaea sp.]|nr:hypothetical protein [Hamadaea sp.]
MTVVFVPPVRTAVADVVTTILRLGGVEVRHGEPAPSIAPTPSPLPNLTSGDLAQARARAAFPIGVPAALGDPQRVELADPGPDGHPRVVTLVYPGVRLDEVDGTLELAFTKTADGVEWLGGDLIWLAEPHPLVYVDRWGRQQTETTRLSGPCLVWQRGSVTYRLEGVTAKEEAVRIARSVS